MIRFGCVSSLRRQVATCSALISALVLVSAASAADLDFNVASGNFTTPGNWVDSTNLIPVATAATPTVADNAYIRNGGTATINSDVAALQIRVGYHQIITNPDYNNNGVVDAADYVLWRKGGPLLNDATPDDVGPDDYAYWRYRFGGTPLVENIGGPGTLNWTAGKITGQGNIGSPPDPYSGGPDIRVGRIENVNGVPTEVAGTVVQNGPTTELLLPYRQSMLTIGDGTTFTNTPTSSYTLMNGTIGLAIGSNNLGTRGSNDNDGILVRNGTFTMTGGQIIDVTPADYSTTGLTSQRFLTLIDVTGAGVGNESVATANLSGGSINVLGGIRVATANHSRGYLNINGPITIVTGGDTSIGYQPNTNGTNAVGVMTMSDGSFQVGREDINPLTGSPYPLAGRFQVGDRGLGTLNMSGGSINVTRNVRVTNQAAAGGSAINMTGGTITTGGLDMRVIAAVGPDDGASIILDGPTASFITTGLGASPTTIIGVSGKALFEVRQGTAVLGGGGSTIQVGNSALSDATINVKGGKLTFGGNVTRSNLGSVAPKIGLTGGTLEFNNTVSLGTHVVHADFKNEGSKLIIRPNAVQLAQIGSSSPAVPANFEMTGGSWDIDIGVHSLTGADWFNVPNGTAALTGGTLNINYLAGFTPNVNEVFRILRASGGTTLNSGAITIAGAGAGSWLLQEVPISGLDEEIQLKYLGPGAGAGQDLLAAGVPEPTSAALVMVGLVGILATRRARHRINA